MDKNSAQIIIKNAITINPEAVIAKAILFNNAASIAVDDVKHVNGPLSGVAAIALKAALRGDTNAATENNMIKFAEFLSA